MKCRNIYVKRYPNNPILGPDRTHDWEAQAVFNGCPIKFEDGYQLLYRALSSPQNYLGHNMELSTIGVTYSQDGLSFTGERFQLIKPEKEWEKYGCEDPRVTKIDDKYYITYTALSDYPHTPQGIKIGLAITKDFKTIEAKHQITRCNSKAMVIFPERINGKIVAMFTQNTDKPPVKIMLAEFDNPEQMWDREYWKKWKEKEDDHTLHFQHSLDDHIEVGAPPLKTKEGWLFFYSYIRNYKSAHPVFGIEAVLLDLNNPRKVIGRTLEPLLHPEEIYERYGYVSNVTFPSGALIKKDKVYIYYGAADTVCAVAELNLKELVDFIKIKDCKYCDTEEAKKVMLERFEGNPILEPTHQGDWESKYVLNPGAIYDKDKIHIIYRAQDENDTSVLGYAVSDDGIHLTEKLNNPIYWPRIPEEIREEAGFSGCEDPRITKMNDKFYMCYTAYNGYGPARVAFTSIKQADFHNHLWHKWEMPQIISPYEIDDKDACLINEKINGKYVFFHRLEGNIWIDLVDDLDFSDGKVLKGEVIMKVGKNSWDDNKIGIAGPPIKIKDNKWLLIYHAVSSEDGQYRLGAAMLNLKEKRELARLKYPILEPKADYENKGLRPGTVFSCGAVVKNGTLFVYYGAADQVIGVAETNYQCLIDALEKEYQSK